MIHVPTRRPSRARCGSQTRAPSIALAFFLFLLTGCPSPPKPRARITALRPESAALAATTETNAAPPAAVATLESALPKPPANAPPSDIWFSWKSWAATNKLSAPKRLPKSAELSYELRADRGALTITIGSRSALWNGINLGLGFGPQLVDGRPFINALDADKNFAPLLIGASFAPQKGRVIVIDAGHGGENTGAKSVQNGHFEKEFTLDWAIRLRSLLKAAGWKVLLTRTSDVDISLSERITFADRAHGDLFLSLHFNSSGATNGAPEHGGLETFCLTPAGMPSSLAREFEDDCTRVYPNNAFDAANLRFAARLHESLIQSTGLKDRGIRRARFMTVIREQTRPAVLLEGGFLSDPQEAKLIASVGYRQLLAEAVARALRE